MTSRRRRVVRESPVDLAPEVFVATYGFERAVLDTELEAQEADHGFDELPDEESRRRRRAAGRYGMDRVLAETDWEAMLAGKGHVVVYGLDERGNTVEVDLREVRPDLFPDDVSRIVPHETDKEDAP